MLCLNLGVLAHVDAGKTTLTEQLLHTAGATRHLGRVDHGDTTTDSDDLERRRGITIRTAVATMTLPSAAGPVRVNLIDTPGHADFIAEVERALGVLDGAVLVVSAVEGVQAQTRVLVRTLERMRLPFLVFVNKVDRAGASVEGTMTELDELLRGAPVALGAQLRREDVVDAVSPWDERLLAEYVERPGLLTRDRLLAAVAEQSRVGHLHPVLTGSALHGVGVAEVLAAVTTYLPVADGDDAGPLHAVVFKIDRDATGHRVAYLRLTQGSLSSRVPVSLHRRTAEGAVEARETRALGVRVVERGAETSTRAARAGEVASVVGLGQVAVGDQLGHWDPHRAGRHFADPGLESVVEAQSPQQKVQLFEALQELAAQDPLIDVRVGSDGGDVTVTIYGEVQKEVLTARLEEEYGVRARFLPTRVVHVERVSGTGEGHARSSLGNVRVGLRLGQAAAGTGLDYGLSAEVEKGWLLPQYHHAIEEQLAAELAQGIYGWRIADLEVRTIASRWAAPVPSPSDFRAVTHLAFRRALDDAGTVVCAPVSRFELEVPYEHLSTVLAAVVELDGKPAPSGDESGAIARVAGTLPTAEVGAFERRLPGYTSGRGTFWSEPAGYEPITTLPFPRR
jgi:ribosomal protection tetracycline resistance protein